jgi:anaerobic magnesium-protoporphyrin IX monomethyl ester cyclase
MRVAFVHTPMPTVPVAPRRRFWEAFDRQYHAAHPGLGFTDGRLWELPHWMHWLGGVLDAAGYPDQQTVDLYSPLRAGSEPDLDFFARKLREQPADVYLFSPMTPNLHVALVVASVIREVHPKAKTLFGGIVATPLQREVAAHPAVDFVIAGRAELALPALLDGLRRGDVSQVQQLGHKDAHGDVVVHPGVYPILPPSELPFPRVDLLPAELGPSLRYLRIVYGLGCPYVCSFCTIQTIGQSTRWFPVERVIREIRAYRARYGPHHVYFGDETFTLRPDRTRALCQALALEGDITFDIQTRLNCLVDEPMLRDLERGGCRWVEIGVEAATEAGLRDHKQRVKLTAAEDTLKRVADHGLSACSFLVNGLPGLSTDEMRRSVDWTCEAIHRGLLRASYLFSMVPYPGSALWSAPEKHGLTLRHRDLSRYHEELPPVYDTPLATSEEMHEAYLDGVECLADAMSARQPDGALPSGDYGSFWDGAHA